MTVIERSIGRSKDRPSAEKHSIEVDTSISKPDAPTSDVLKVDGIEVALVNVARTVAGAFTASETLDVGADLGSPMSLDYFDRRLSSFKGKINIVTVELK